MLIGGFGVQVIHATAIGGLPAMNWASLYAGKVQMSGTILAMTSMNGLRARTVRKPPAILEEKQDPDL